MSGKTVKPRRIVAKFGGTSIASGELIAKAASSVAREAKNGVQVVVVVSAMGKTTDQLIETASKASADTGEAESVDDILSMGERTAARVFKASLESQGIKARYLDPSSEDWPIITDEKFKNANPIVALCEEKIQSKIVPLLETGIVPVIPGFVGKTQDGRITTMGRGGSDTTAFLIGNGLGADEVILVTDVEGIMSADPKLVKKAKVLGRIPVEKLANLADLGTKFIHSKALKYKGSDRDVRVVGHLKGDLAASGTLIHGSMPELYVDDALQSPATAVTIFGEDISSKPEIILTVVSIIKEAGISLLGMSSTHDSVILYLPMDRVTDEVAEELHSAIVSRDEELAMGFIKKLALLRVRGMGLEETPGIIGKVVQPLYDRGINIYGVFTIASSVVLFVKWEDRDAVKGMIEKSTGAKRA
ncbi:MAG TPA: aspartate kinase [Candidatus Bathyarchaeia archaeon]|nr:aspartate kinase [Candidatus Bathyarchaeia archaeon]